MEKQGQRYTFASPLSRTITKQGQVLPAGIGAGSQARQHHREPFTEVLDGLPGDEADALLDYLLFQARVPEYQVRFRWEPGSVAIWDNRITQHYAVSDYFPQRRVMERVTMVGDQPF